MKKLTRKIIAGPHSVVRQRDIPAVHAMLELIKTRNGGRLTPKAVVAYVRHNPKSILARYFDDPKEAVVRWWLQQARELIQSFYIVVEERDDLPPMRLYLNVREVTAKKKGVSYGYIDSFQVLNDDRFRAQLFNEALAEIETWTRKYETLKAYYGLIGKLHSGISRVLKHRKKHR